MFEHKMVSFLAFLKNTKALSDHSHVCKFLTQKKLSRGMKHQQTVPCQITIRKAAHFFAYQYLFNPQKLKNIRERYRKTWLRFTSKNTLTQQKITFLNFIANQKAVYRGRQFGKSWKTAGRKIKKPWATTYS